MRKRWPWWLALAIACASGSAPSLAADPDAVAIIRRHGQLAPLLGEAASLTPLHGDFVSGDGIAISRLARGPLEVRSKRRGFLRIVADDVADVAAAHSGRLLVYRDAQPGVDIVRLAGVDRAEELRVYRVPRATLRVRYHVQSKGLTARSREGRIEYLDGAGRIAFITPPALAFDATGAALPVTTTATPVGIDVVVDSGAAAFPVVLDPTWIALPEMNEGRALGRAVELLDGRVLVAGGTNGTSALSSAELFDAKTRTWKVAAPMSVPRENPAAVRLRSGEVLVACGTGEMAFHSSAEVYDPADDRWFTLGTVHGGCANATATLLPDDRVLVVGGLSTRAASVLDPATSMFTATANMITPRMGHAAVTLTAGRVLVAGGARLSSSAISSAEIFDPATGIWTAAAPMPTARLFASGVRLPDGRALISGGVGSDDAYLATADVYDPATDAWAKVGAMSNARALHALVTTPAGLILAAGGRDKSEAYDSVDVFDLKKLEWSPFTAMLEARSAPAALTLTGGEVLVAGGAAAGGTLSTAEIFGAARAGGGCATTADCAAGVCADGVCCDRACDGVCEACDVMGSRGACTPISGRARHGTCGDYACVAGACGKSCTKDTECASGKRCQSGVCTSAALCDGGDCGGADAGAPPPSSDAGGCSCATPGNRPVERFDLYPTFIGLLVAARRLARRAQTTRNGASSSQRN